MPKLKINSKPRFEQMVTKLMNERPLQGRSKKRTWEEAADIVCKRYPEIYNKYLEKLSSAAEGAK